jgi:gas vesicle protein
MMDGMIAMLAAILVALCGVVAGLGVTWWRVNSALKSGVLNLKICRDMLKYLRDDFDGVSNDMTELGAKVDLSHQSKDVVQLTFKEEANRIRDIWTGTIDKHVTEAKTEIVSEIADVKAELRDDMSELRQLLFRHVNDHDDQVHKQGKKRSDKKR